MDPRSRVDPVNVVSQNQGVESPDSAWKTGVDQSISGLADSLKLIQDSLSSLVEEKKGSKTKKRKTKPKTQVSKKSKSGKSSEPDLVQVRAKVIPSTQGEGFSLGSILNTSVSGTAGSMPLPQQLLFQEYLDLPLGTLSLRGLNMMKITMRSL